MYPILRFAMIKRICTSLFVLSFVLTLGACGDTWRGAKKDTSDNLKATEEAIDD